jgi:hypothetical protein
VLSQFLRVLERDLAVTDKTKEAFLADFTQVTEFLNLFLFCIFFFIISGYSLHPPMLYHREDYDDIMNSWARS